MAAGLMSIAECDRRLMAMTDAYYDAVKAGDLESADACYAERDALLDQRPHLPLPRTNVVARLLA